ncbi:MAG: response regulator [Bacteroidia bacterium]|nr:response regulator [Bacteroidia bacterium]MCX7651301.1 response regulator [Bacteroidia bacterium]MDW8417702.1 response regulator [Bacteroidia bacterium]
MSRPVILFVDDEKIVLDTLVVQVRSAFGDKYDYETAQSAEEAWELIREYKEAQRRIVLLISDWLMPLEKGDSFLIRVASHYPDVRLIMLSAYADDDAIERAQRYANLFAFIRKPWERDALVSQIQNALLA